MSIQMDPPRSPVPAVAQALAEAALQRQNMLLGADKGIPGAAAPGAGNPTRGVPPLPTPNPAAAAAQQGRGVAVSPAAIPTLAAAGAGGVTGAAWPASGVSPAMRGLLDALVQQLTPAAPQSVVAVQPWGAGLGGAGGLPADPDLPPLQTWLVGQGLLHTEQGPRAFTATLRVPAAWLQGLPTASPPPSPAPSGTLQAALAGRSQALTSGLFALVLQPGVGAGERAAATSALLSLELAPWQVAASVVYGRDQLQARNDPWLQMLALQASGYGREEEEADLRRRARGHCDTPGCPYAGRAPCEQPFCLAMRVVPVQAVPPVGGV